MCVELLVTHFLHEQSTAEALAALSGRMILEHCVGRLLRIQNFTLPTLWIRSFRMYQIQSKDIMMIINENQELCTTLIGVDSDKFSGLDEIR